MLNITANSLNFLHPRGRFKFSVHYKNHLQKLVTCLRVVFHHIQYLVSFYLGYYWQLYLLVHSRTLRCLGFENLSRIKLSNPLPIFTQCHGLLFDYVPACHQFSDISVSSNAPPKRGLKWFPAHNCSTMNRTTHTVKLA